MNKNKDKDIRAWTSYEKTMNNVKIMKKKMTTLNLVYYGDGTSKEEDDDEVQSSEIQQSMWGQ